MTARSRSVPTSVSRSRLQAFAQEQSWTKIALFRLQPMPGRETTCSSAGLVVGRSETDLDIARTLEAFSHAAWSIPRDKYYAGGDRYRSLNRLGAEIVEGGVKVWLSEESTPYVQLKKYNTTIGGLPREYAPLPAEIAGSIGVRKMIAYHLHHLPLSQAGTRYLVNLHLIRFTATPGRPCDTSPPGLHKDGEKYIATHLLGRCGARRWRSRHHRQ